MGAKLFGQNLLLQIELHYAILQLFRPVIEVQNNPELSSEFHDILSNLEQTRQLLATTLYTE